MKAFKATDKHMKCRSFQFEIGKMYSTTGELRMCMNGFHACKRLIDVLLYYSVTNSRFFEVEIDDFLYSKEMKKFCARHITFLRELTFAEAFAGFNVDEKGNPFDACENTNIGFSNYGNNNHGNDNHGYNNHGNDNHGNDNHGNDNHGNDNKGNGNYGYNNYGNNNYGNDNYGNDNHGNDMPSSAGSTTDTNKP